MAIGRMCGPQSSESETSFAPLTRPSTRSRATPASGTAGGNRRRTEVRWYRPAVPRSPSTNADEVDLGLAIPGVVSLYVFLQAGQIIGVGGEPEAIRAVPAISHCEDAGHGTGEFLGRYGYETHCCSPWRFLSRSPPDRSPGEKQRHLGLAAGRHCLGQRGPICTVKTCIPGCPRSTTSSVLGRPKSSPLRLHQRSPCEGSR